VTVPCPPHLKTKEFYTLLKNRMAVGGVVALNLHRGNRLFASDQATLQAVFREVHLIEVPGTGNIIALAFDVPAPDFSALDIANLPVPAPLAQSIKEHLSAAIRSCIPVQIPVGTAVLTDDFAPAEFLQQQSVEE